MLALTALYFRWAPAYLAAAHPSLDECAPALLPLLLPRLLAVSALPLLVSRGQAPGHRAVPFCARACGA